MFNREDGSIVAGYLALLAVAFLLLTPLAHAGLHADEVDHHGTESPLCKGDCVLCEADVWVDVPLRMCPQEPIPAVLSHQAPAELVPRPMRMGTVRSGRAPPTERA